MKFLSKIGILLLGACSLFGLMFLPSAPTSPPDLTIWRQLDFKYELPPPVVQVKRPWLNPARAALKI